MVIRASFWMFGKLCAYITACWVCACTGVELAKCFLWSAYRKITVDDLNAV